MLWKEEPRGSGQFQGLPASHCLLPEPKQCPPGMECLFHPLRNSLCLNELPSKMKGFILEETVLLTAVGVTVYCEGGFAVITPG